MPEMRFELRWPDGSVQSCYSPSLVIAEHLEPGAAYPLDEFVGRARTALREASERVRVRYGIPCARALAELNRIERRAGACAGVPNGAVTVLAFRDGA